MDELLARADQAAQRIAAERAERQASSDYAGRMELQAQTQAEAHSQAEAQDEVELERLFRSLSAFPNEPVDQVVYQGYCLCFAAARIGQDLAARFAVVNAKNRPSRSASTARVRILPVANLSPVRLARISPAAIGPAHGAQACDACRRPLRSIGYPLIQYGQRPLDLVALGRQRLQHLATCGNGPAHLVGHDSKIRQMTDVSGCNLQQRFSCNRHPTYRGSKLVSRRGRQALPGKSRRHGTRITIGMFAGVYAVVVAITSILAN